MKSEIHPSKAAQNSHGNVSIPRVNRNELGTCRYPIILHRGVKGESGVWIALFKNLPGYLGIGFTTEDALSQLWSILGDDPVYDVSGSRGIDPTPENIRHMLDRAKLSHKVADHIDHLGITKDSAIAAACREFGLSRNTLRPVFARREKWAQVGGLRAATSNVGMAEQREWLAYGRDPQAYLEDHPEKARLLLARQKFPQ
jgi:hypothetical protein